MAAGMEMPRSGMDMPAGPLPGAGRAHFGKASASAMSMKWSALHDAARVVGHAGGRLLPGR